MKRFTETGKWRDPWFRALSADAKLLFWYLTENCDAAGVWEVDEERLRFELRKDFGDQLATSLRAELGDRIVVLDGGHRWWMPRFIGFAYGTLNGASPFYGRAFACLKAHDLTERYVLWLQENKRPMPHAVDTLTQGYHNTPGVLRKRKRKIGGESREEGRRRAAPFTPPTLAEVTAYGNERRSLVDPKQFWEHYANGNPPWTDVHGNQVRAWKQKFVTWERRETEKLRVPGSAPVKPRPPDNLAEILARSKKPATGEAAHG